MADIPGGGRNGHEPDANALAALVDGHLDAAERTRIVEHLGDCAQCRDIVAHLQRFSAQTIPVRRWSTASLSLAATLAIAAGGAGLYWMINNRTSQSPMPASEPAPPPPAPVGTRPDAEPTIRPETPSSSPARGSSGGVQRQPDRTRSVGTRTIGGKTFRLVAGEWIDESYHVTDLLPAVEVSTEADFNAHPALRPFRTLGSRFTVVIDGKAYHVALPPTQH